MSDHWTGHPGKPRRTSLTNPATRSQSAATSRADRSFKQAQVDIERWLASLDKEIESARRSIKFHQKQIEKGKEYFETLELIARQRLDYNTALKELLSRGLDPTKRRTFHGRILLDVRCTKRHLLARVYPTTVAPVIVPSASAPPVGRNRLKENRFNSESYLAAKAWRNLLKGTEFEDPRSYRDEWILDFTDHEKSGAANLTIRGLSLLEERLKRTEDTYEGTPYIPCFEFTCRCGEVWLRTADVMEALDARQRVLTARSIA